MPENRENESFLVCESLVIGCVAALTLEIVDVFLKSVAGGLDLNGFLLKKCRGCHELSIFNYEHECLTIKKNDLVFKYLLEICHTSIDRKIVVSNFMDSIEATDISKNEAVETMFGESDPFIRLLIDRLWLAKLAWIMLGRKIEEFDNDLTLHEICFG